MLTFPLINDTSRKIIHIDMDAFFASVEQRDNPSLRGKPIVIARSPIETRGRGVVSTASYEARKFGVHSAMSSKEAFDLCPQAIFISGNHAKYANVSRQVKEIFYRYTDKVQMASVDEAYLDVTENKIGTASAVKIAKLIQYDIYHELGLTCSAGVSYNKFLAKIGSDFEKPHGLTVVKPEDAFEFLGKLPIEKFHGVGKASAPKLHEMGIYLGKDIQKTDPLVLSQHFGVFGWYLYLRANGIHDSQVHNSRIRKSIGKERTFSQFLKNEFEIQKELKKICNKVAESLKRHDTNGNIVILKIRYDDFSTFTKRKKFADLIDSEDKLERAVNEILEAIELEDKEIRLLGVTVSGFEEQQGELDIQDLDAV
ncbi:MAG: DNA polymerase IV [Streptococcaceae bacterium]|jgi:DNA polymerase-4|nr:DNA polymerase IV [Streptococcaceae bacterium]